MKIHLSCFIVPSILALTRSTININGLTELYFEDRQILVTQEEYQENFSDLTLINSGWERGFFLKICSPIQEELAKVSIEAKLYQDQKLIKLEEYLGSPNDYGDRNIISKLDKTESGCRVISVRGVVEINLSIKDQVTQPFFVEILSEHWIRDTQVRSVLYYMMLPTLPIIISMVVFYNKNWCICLQRQNQYMTISTEEVQKQIDKTEKIVDWKLLLFQVLSVTLFLSDIISDISYMVGVPFANTQLKGAMIVTFLLPFYIALVPTLLSYVNGCFQLFMLCLRNKGKIPTQEFERKKFWEQVSQFTWKYFGKATIYFIIIITNSVQVLSFNRLSWLQDDRKNQVQIRKRAINQEIDEKILKIETNNEHKRLSRNIIKQFGKYYKSINFKKELQDDYAIFMSSWMEVSENKKGRFIDSENIVQFFEMIGRDRGTQIVHQQKNQKVKKERQLMDNALEKLQTDYQFDEKINKEYNKGKYGRIFEAHKKKDKNYRVVILLIKKYDHTEAEIEEVNQDFTEMSQLNSPYIADYLEKYEDRKKLYLVMEFIKGLSSIQEVIQDIDQKNEEGQDSNDELDKNVFNLQDEDDFEEIESNANKLIKQLLLAVSHMHTSGVTHGEIKPENISVDSQGDIKITDLKLFRKPQAIDSDDLPYYDSPEIINKQEKTKSQESDIWSIGIIMYNLFTGDQPFNGDNAKDVRMLITSNKALQFKDDIFTGRDNAKDLIQKLLDKNKALRIDTAEKALNHEWFKMGEEQQLNKAELKKQKQETKEVLTNLKKFKRRSELKMMALDQLSKYLKDRKDLYDQEQLERKKESAQIILLEGPQAILQQFQLHNPEDQEIVKQPKQMLESNEEIFTKVQDHEEAEIFLPEISNKKKSSQSINIHSIDPQITSKQYSKLELKSSQFTENEIECFEHFDKIRRVFDNLDNSKNGILSQQELQKAYKTFKAYASQEETIQIIENVNFNRSGLLNFDDFLNSSISVTTYYQSLTTSEEGKKVLKTIFYYFKMEKDSMDKDYLLKDDIEAAYQKIDDRGIPEQDLERVFIEHDLKNNQKITFEEFMTIFDTNVFPDIASKIRKELLKASKDDENLSKDEKALKMAQKIEEKMKFIQDDGMICYTEFLYKVMKYKWDKLDTNIFIINTISLFDENCDDFDRHIQEHARDNIDQHNQSLNQARTQNQESKITAQKSKKNFLEKCFMNKSKENQLNDSDINVKRIHESIELYIKRNQVLNSKDDVDEEFSPFAPQQNQQLVNAIHEKQESEPEEIGEILDIEDQSDVQKNKMPLSAKNEELIDKLMEEQYKGQSLMIKINRQQGLQFLHFIDKRKVINMLYALDVEVFLAQKQDLKLYHYHLPQIRPRMNKPELENYYCERDLIQASNKQEYKHDFSLTKDQFATYTELQLGRFSRMSGFSFKCPDEKFLQKFKLLLQLQKCESKKKSQKILFSTIALYQNEKAKPYQMDMSILDEKLKEETDRQKMMHNLCIVDLLQVKDIYQDIISSRISLYKQRLNDLRKNSDPIALEGNLNKDPVFKKFNKDLLQFGLKGATFKQTGMIVGKFSICLGDIEDLKGSQPYIDNSKDQDYSEDDQYEYLIDPMIFPEQSMIIARMDKNKDLLIFIFDQSFRIINDGMRLKERLDQGVIKYDQTHSFNSWVDFKSSDHEYLERRKRMQYLVHGFIRQTFIRTKNDKNKDEEDEAIEEKIRKAVEEEHRFRNLKEDIETKKQQTLIKYGLSMFFGLLEDAPQLILQIINTILIGRTLTFVQLLSPLTSSISIASRAFNMDIKDVYPVTDVSIETVKSKKIFILNITIFNMCFIFPLFTIFFLVILFNVFEQSTTMHQDWIQQNFDISRSNQAGFGLNTE